MPVRAVIFDYKALLIRTHTSHSTQIRELLDWLHVRGVRPCIFSTDPLSPAQSSQLGSLGCLPTDCYISRSDIPNQKNRGSPAWIDAASQTLHLARRELLYIGCTALDWRTAINSGVFYLHGLWACPIPPGTTSLVAQSPADVRTFLEYFLLGTPRWTYSLDGSDWTLRSLLSANARLPSSSPASTFTLQDIFTYDRTIKIGSHDARDVLMLLVIADAYLDGLLPANLYFCVYPSCRTGTVSDQLRAYIRPAASLFHGYYRDDLLVRALDAPDTSLVRWRARQAGTTADISIATQATTVHIGPNYRHKLSNKTIVVFDDFTTEGISLEWARMLLSAGGAQRIVLLTVGKYGSRYSHYGLKSGRYLDPYSPNTLSRADFELISLTPATDSSAEQHFANIIRNMTAVA